MIPAGHANEADIAPRSPVSRHPVSNATHAAAVGQGRACQTTNSICMMARLIIAPAGGCIRTRQIGKCAAKHRRPPFAPCCHAAFETASQIGITDRAQGDDDLLLIGIRPVIIGRWERVPERARSGNIPPFLLGFTVKL